MAFVTADQDRFCRFLATSLCKSFKITYSDRGFLLGETVATRAEVEEVVNRTVNRWKKEENA